MTRALVVRLALPAAVLIAAACRIAPEAAANGATSRAAVAIDSATLLRDLAVLADDSLRGRESGTEGNRQARLYIAAAFDRFGLDSVSGRRVHPFNFVNSRDSATIAAANVIGLVRGTVNPSRYIVVTAHYDHVGVGRPVEGDSIYNGADDNASGTAALLALAEHFAGAGGGAAALDPLRRARRGGEGAAGRSRLRRRPARGAQRASAQREHGHGEQQRPR